MENLKTICNRLEGGRHSLPGPYFIPETWNTVGYDQYVKAPGREGQIGIEPYSFMAFCIKRAILRNAGPNLDYGQPLDDQAGNRELNLSQSVIYSLFTRTFSAWDHYRQGEICPGTFLKAICLLPYLKELQVDIIYLLPVFTTSDRYKKGELGSPYAIKNSYRLDPNLHDTLLGGDPAAMVATEFKAFVEACHILKIKVMLDFVFRTVARDNDLLADHPDWFYWIRRQNSQTFLPPAVAGVKNFSSWNERTLQKLYTSKGMADYLARFTPAPSVSDPVKWRQVLARYHETGANLLDLIEETFQVTTAPGFSNVLNDPQPPWTDVTYLKFYDDGNSQALSYLPENQPPYILQDGACLNHYRGTVPNRELWDYVTGIIPYYQEQYGIDGARIDMGHALPLELNQAIVARVKRNNRHFILWSEEFASEHSRAVKEEGFDFISGNLWSVYNDIDQPSFTRKIFQTVSRAALPVTAALETPDTPRMALLYPGRRRITLLVWLNFLMANAVPFINNGMELMEIQPMNLGLNNDDDGRFVLPPEDPMYGKLAFFDVYRLNWLNPEQGWLRRLLAEVLTIRKRYGALIGARANFSGEYRHIKNPKIIFFGYYDRNTGQNLFFLANRHFQERARIAWLNLFPEEVRRGCRTIRRLNNESGLINDSCDLKQSGWLTPGEVVIGCLE